MPHTEQLIFDIKTDNSNMLRNKKFLEETLISISNILGTAVVDKMFYKFNSGGRGITGVLLLKESHISIHTWPEHSSATLDVFSCKKMNCRLVKEFINNNLHIKSIKYRRFTRKY